MRPIAIFLTTTIWLIGLSGCDTSTTTDKGEPLASSQQGGKVVCVLVDRSSSTDEQGVRQRYSDSFRRILEKLGSGDRIVADAITDNPLGQSSFPVNDEFEPFQPGTDNPLMVRKKLGEHEEKMKGRRDSVWTKAQELFSSAPSKQTKIIDATLLAERVFKTYQRPKKVLVIFSDMIEESDSYNFQKDPPNDKVTKRIIDEETKARRLPDLKGVKVYVIGASASTYKQNSSKAYMDILNFWQQYFEAAGADFSRDRYGAALISFEE